MIVKSELVQWSDLTGVSQQCTLVDGTVCSIPLARVTIDTPFYKGEVEAMCMEKPVYDLIVGNLVGAGNTL